MSLYDNLNKQSALMAAEFSAGSGGSLAFFYLNQPEQKEALKQWITDTAKQEITAETVVEGHTVFVTRGKPQQELMDLIAERGDQIVEHQEKKGGLDPWKLRSYASVIGQSLQLLSASKQVMSHNHAGQKVWTRKGWQMDMLMFASLNMSANVFNWMFGSQKSPDTHHLNYLKEQTNERLAPHLKEGEKPIDIHDKRQELRPKEKESKKDTSKINQFLKRNSVMIGEIGLRYIATIGLVFPMFAKNGHLG